MAATLQEILLAPDTQPQVVADCLKLIEQEVSGKSGVSGTAVKLAYKTAKTFASGYLQSTVESLLPDLVAALEPFWADFGASGAAGFGDYLVKRGEEVSEALLAVSDARAAMSESAHDLEGVRRRPRRRRQARRGRAAERRRPGAEVRGLTAHLTGTSSSGRAVAAAGSGPRRGTGSRSCCQGRLVASQYAAPASRMPPMVQPSG